MLRDVPLEYLGEQKKLHLLILSIYLFIYLKIRHGARQRLLVYEFPFRTVAKQGVSSIDSRGLDEQRAGLEVERLRSEPALGWRMPAASQAVA